MYQMPGERSAGGDQPQNGLPLSSPPEYSAAKSQNQLRGGNQPASSARVEQLEAEVLRLRGALAEKTVEAQSLQQKLQSTLQLIEKHQLSQQQRQDNPDTVTDVETPSNKESPETPTAVSSQD